MSEATSGISTVAKVPHIACAHAGYGTTRLTTRWANQLKCESPDKLAVQPPHKKYFCFSEMQIRCISSPVPHPSGGALRIVTDVGCGMRWTRQHTRRMRLPADGEVVWS